jgi:acetylornithine deacetylase/succinyl-diaminopimelate desuccinylase-like protein
LIFDLDQGAPALRSSGDSSIANRVTNAYEEVLGVPCKKIVSGGSIPVVSDLAAASGGDVLVMGFGLGTDQIHAPNEHFGLERLKQGFLTIGRIFASFK